MDISHLMIHDQQIKEETIKEKTRELKRAKMGDGEFSKSRSDGHGCPEFQQIFSGLNLSNVPEPKLKIYRMSNPKPQGGGSSGSLDPACQKCGRSHSGKCLA
ncbi:hypothetical protein MTR67_043223 [Solanum verrucosum]|uniref:Gag-pol polyprotein n=1 Tax=Solanum verrucosum TaxID=315347 RepID=A0AAF0UNB7_SOLVR|nr:hypothetical protein MTR67_043223 [Solanum verrucosum]